MIVVDTEYRTKAQHKWLEVRALNRGTLENIDRSKVKDPVLLQFVDKRLDQLNSWHRAPSKLLEEQLEIKERKATKPMAELERIALEVDIAEIIESWQERVDLEKVKYFRAPKTAHAFIEAFKPLDKAEMEEAAECLFTKKSDLHPIERLPAKIYHNRRVLFVDGVWKEFTIIRGDPSGIFYMEAGRLDGGDKVHFNSKNLRDLINNRMDLASIDGIFVGTANKPISLKEDVKRALPLVPVVVEI